MIIYRTLTKIQHIGYLFRIFFFITAQRIHRTPLEKYLDKLEAKTTVGELLAVKAQAQGLKLVDIPEADEIYTREWALNTAAVTKLLLGD